MGNEYRAKVFKSGNSVALRLPKALGLEAGQEMVVRAEHGKFEFEPLEHGAALIDLSGIYGSVKYIERLPFDVIERDWGRPFDDG